MYYLDQLIKKYKLRLPQGFYIYTTQNSGGVYYMFGNPKNITIKPISPGKKLAYELNFWGKLKLSKSKARTWDLATKSQINQAYEKKYLAEKTEEPQPLIAEFKNLKPGMVFAADIGCDDTEGSYLMIQEEKLGVFSGILLDSGFYVKNSNLDIAMKHRPIIYNNLDEALGAEPGKKLTIVTEDL